MVGPYSSTNKCQHKSWQHLRLAKSEIFVISLCKKHSNKKHGVELFKDPDNGVGFSQFTILICNRSFLLNNYSTCLVVKRICVYIDKYVMVGICHEDISNEHSFCYFKFIFHFCCSIKGLLPDLLDNDFIKCACIVHVSQYVFTAPRKQ